MSISVNSKIIICYCPKECSALHWWAKQNDVYNKRCQHVYTFLKKWRVVLLSIFFVSNSQLPIAHSGYAASSKH